MIYDKLYVLSSIYLHGNLFFRIDLYWSSYALASLEDANIYVYHSGNGYIAQNITILLQNYHHIDYVMWYLPFFYHKVWRTHRLFCTEHICLSSLKPSFLWYMQSCLLWTQNTTNTFKRHRKFITRPLKK